MQNTNYVTAGKPAVGGAISRAVYGAALPTSAVASLASAFKGLGYISDAGLTNTNAISSTDIKAWGGDTVLTIQSEKTDTFKTVLIEVMNLDVLKAIFGASNVSGALATGITVNVNAAEQVAASWVVDMVLKNGSLKRVVIPNGKITALDDVTYSDSAAVGYGITITAMPDTNGNTHYEYILDVNASSVTLSANEATVAEGATTTLTATTTPSGGTVKWSSADTDVATVTGGVITGVAAGSTTVTARCLETGATAVAAVTVTET